MNLLLLGYMFYVQSSSNRQRQETVGLIVQQQNDTEKLLASCVSSDVTRTMLDHMQLITNTMLAAEQKEIQRMQDVVNSERQRSWELRERERKRLDELEPSAPKPEPQKNIRPDRTLLKLPPLPSIPYLPISSDQPN